MRGRLAAILLLALAAAAPAAEPGAPVISARPDAVAVTVYRSPYGWQQPGAIDLNWLNGFALVTETRTLRLPAGAATVRFEGVAGGIVPASALVTGLPGGVIEKNRDARLLAPAALVDGSLGKRVTLTRTDRKTGRSVSEDAVIVAGPADGVVVRTKEGVEALGCSGLAEHPVYPRVPAGLSAGPVLSVETVSPRAQTVTATLSYLASEFDWSASYVATIRPDGRHLDLFAWLTLANGNAESFPAADVQAVAGRLNRSDERFRVFAAPLELHCYPLGTTTDVPAITAQDVGEIVVTGQRLFRMAVPAPAAPPAPPPPPPPEDLGDLKLFRAPERVTVAANTQKQVALLGRADVPFTRVYRRTVYPAQSLLASSTGIVLRMENVAAGGLGMPLPAGSTALYVGRGRDRLLVGTGTLRDKAVGETVRIGAGRSTQVTVTQVPQPNGPTRLEVSNANPAPVTVEVAVDVAPANLHADVPFATIEGKPTWVVTLAPGETRHVGYRVH